MQSSKISFVIKLKCKMRDLDISIEQDLVIRKRRRFRSEWAIAQVNKIVTVLKECLNDVGPSTGRRNIRAFICHAQYGR